MLTITPVAARRLAIMAQRLGGARPKAGKAGMLEVLRALRCVQLDPISVVARSHQLVLWSRLGQYDPQHLETLLWHDRTLFEYWAHCASLVLTEDMHIHARRMRDYREGGASAARYVAWLNANAALRDHILESLRQQGPLAPRHFEDRSETEWYSTGWTSGRTVSQMLQTLWLQGHILVAGRKGTTRLWDLAEHVLPSTLLTEEVADAYLDRVAVLHALRALGIARARDIRQHFIRGRYRDLGQTLSALETEGAIVRVAVHGEDQQWPGPWYVQAEMVAQLENPEVAGWRPRTTLLSPFDNLICDRLRTLQLFNFDYHVEIYIPPAKRRYGYYAMPILHGDRLIGRVDPAFERATKRLVIQHFTLEPQVKLTKASGRAILAAIEDLAAFVGASEVSLAEGVAWPWV